MKIKINIRNWIAALLFVATSGGSLVTLAAPNTAFAACDARLLTMPAWYNGLTDDKCNIKTSSDAKFIWTIVLNLIEAGLHIAGYVAVGFIIKGGFKYMTSTGSSEGVNKARSTIFNAVIGLIISIFSIAIVRLVAESIK